MPYLLKTEPSAYSIDQLARDGETVWDGVANPQAIQNLRGMTPGERVVIYHSTDDRRAVGMATVVSVDATDPKAPLVRIRFAGLLRTPRTLAEIKAQPVFAASPLVRQPRLSVVPLDEAQYAWLTLEE